MGWVIESLFGPVATYRNREMLYNLMAQVDRLAKVTRKGFKDLNLQLQATTKMTLQNRMALDMLLIKEHEVCSYLKDKIDHCCVHIPNVTADVEYDISQLAHVEQDLKEEKHEIEQDWLEVIFEGLGLHLQGWVKSLLQTITLLLIGFIVLWLMYICIRREIAKSSAWNRRIMGILTKEHSQHPTPPPYSRGAFELKRNPSSQ